jgi:hypothetical protein
MPSARLNLSLSIYIDDILYDFEITVKQSNIPGAGNGAFLTFKRARKLKDALVRALTTKMHKEIDVEDETLTKQPLRAQSWDGFGCSVKLSGDNLHGNHNSDYWPKDGSGHDLDQPKPPTTRDGNPLFGFLRMHTEADYKPAPKLTFSNVKFKGSENTIMLGRYGPFRKQDRKTERLVALKTVSASFERCC